MTNHRTTPQSAVDELFAAYVTRLSVTHPDARNYAMVRHSGIGLRIEEVRPAEGHAHSLPFGHAFRTRSQMADVLRFALDTLHIVRESERAAADAARVSSGEWELDHSVEAIAAELDTNPWGSK